MPQRKERLSNRCRMMSKVINDLYSVDFSAEFLTTTDSGKASQGAPNNFNRKPVRKSDRNCHCRVSDVEFPNQRRFKPVAAYHELRSDAVVSNISDLMGSFVVEPNSKNLAERLPHHVCAMRIISIDE